MANYWVSFTVHRGDRPKGTYAERREHIYNKTRGPTFLNSSWSETTSFIIFSGDDDIDRIGRQISAGLDGEVDLFLIGQVGYQSARFWGAVQYPATLASLYPGTKPL